MIKKKIPERWWKSTREVYLPKVERTESMKQYNKIWNEYKREEVK